MKEFSFCKFNPAGNATVFLLAKEANPAARAYYCARALQRQGVGGEQAAFADLHNQTFIMGGGEFCLNAARAFGALLDMQSAHQTRERQYQALLAGENITLKLRVNGRPPVWEVCVQFALSCLSINNLARDMRLVILPGITHLLIEVANLPSDKEGKILAPELIKKYELENFPAAGVVWWQKNEKGVEILPYVQVPTAGTAMIESSCGSASLALARILAANANLQILQPSGAWLNVEFANDKFVSVSGPVRLAATGKVWLPEFGGEEACSEKN